MKDFRISPSRIFFKIGIQAYNFIKKRLQHRCFPVKLAMFLRTPFFKEHLVWWQLLLCVGEDLKQVNQICKNFLKMFLLQNYLQKKIGFGSDIYKVIRLEGVGYSFLPFSPLLQLVSDEVGSLHLKQQKQVNLNPVNYSILP